MLHACRTAGRFVPFILLSLTAPLPTSAAVPEETYVRAAVDEDGQLRILTAGGRIIEPNKDGDQVAFAKPKISPDGSAVGWLAEYPNCCTSYPVPRKLAVLTRSGVRIFTGNGLMLSRWQFQAGGARVAFRQETVHGGLNVHYELHDVSSSRLLARYQPTVGPDNRELPMQGVPAWVAELDRSDR